MERRNKKLSQNPDGWAAPVVAGEHYHVWWPPVSSPQSVRVEVTNLRDATKTDSTIPEHLFLTFNYTQVWGYLGTQVSGANLYPNTTTFPDIRVNRTGESYRSFANNTMSVLLSGKGRPADAGWNWNQRVTVIADPCPPEGCPAPGVATVERESRVRCDVLVNDPLWFRQWAGECVKLKYRGHGGTSAAPPSSRCTPQHTAGALQEVEQCDNVAGAPIRAADDGTH
jgi:hypothetical protein